MMSSNSSSAGATGDKKAEGEGSSSKGEVKLLDGVKADALGKLSALPLRRPEFMGEDSTIADLMLARHKYPTWYRGGVLDSNTRSVHSVPTITVPYSRVAPAYGRAGVTAAAGASFIKAGVMRVMGHFSPDTLVREAAGIADKSRLMAFPDPFMHYRTYNVRLYAAPAVEAVKSSLFSDLLKEGTDFPLRPTPRMNAGTTMGIRADTLQIMATEPALMSYGINATTPLLTLEMYKKAKIFISMGMEDITRLLNNMPEATAALQNGADGWTYDPTLADKVVGRVRFSNRGHMAHTVGHDWNLYSPSTPGPGVTAAALGLSGRSNVVAAADTWDEAAAARFFGHKMPFRAVNPAGGFINTHDRYSCFPPRRKVQAAETNANPYNYQRGCFFTRARGTNYDVSGSAYKKIFVPGALLLDNRFSSPGAALALYIAAFFPCIATPTVSVPVTGSVYVEDTLGGGVINRRDVSFIAECIMNGGGASLRWDMPAADWAILLPVHGTGGGADPKLEAVLRPTWGADDVQQTPYPAAAEAITAGTNISILGEVLAGGAIAGLADCQFNICSYISSWEWTLSDIKLMQPYFSRIHDAPYRDINAGLTVDFAPCISDPSANDNPLNVEELSYWKTALHAPTATFLAGSTIAEAVGQVANTGVAEFTGSLAATSPSMHVGMDCRWTTCKPASCNTDDLLLPGFCPLLLSAAVCGFTKVTQAKCESTIPPTVVAELDSGGDYFSALAAIALSQALAIDTMFAQSNVPAALYNAQDDSSDFAYGYVHRSLLSDDLRARNSMMSARAGGKGFVMSSLLDKALETGLSVYYQRGGYIDSKIASKPTSIAKNSYTRIVRTQGGNAAFAAQPAGMCTPLFGFCCPVSYFDTGESVSPEPLPMIARRPGFLTVIERHYLAKKTKYPCLMSDLDNLAAEFVPMIDGLPITDNPVGGVLMQMLKQEGILLSAATLDSNEDVRKMISWFAQIKLVGVATNLAAAIAMPNAPAWRFKSVYAGASLDAIVPVWLNWEFTYDNNGRFAYNNLNRDVRVPHTSFVATIDAGGAWTAYTNGYSPYGMAEIDLNAVDLSSGRVAYPQLGLASWRALLAALSVTRIPDSFPALSWHGSKEVSYYDRYSLLPIIKTAFSDKIVAKVVVKAPFQDDPAQVPSGSSAATGSDLLEVAPEMIVPPMLPKAVVVVAGSSDVGDVDTNTEGAA